MRVLGIDPGSVVCGYGVIEKKGKNIVLLEYGVIEAAKRHKSIPLRLKEIFTRLQKVIDRTLPDEISLETVFYAKNVSSIIKLSQARGVAMLAATLKEIPVAEYSPKEVKRAVVGNGGAAKEQVQYMVRNLLGIEETPEFYDATDALAVAICHVLRPLNLEKRATSWKQFVERHPEKIVSPRK